MRPGAWWVVAVCAVALASPIRSLGGIVRVDDHSNLNSSNPRSSISTSYGVLAFEGSDFPVRWALATANTANPSRGDHNVGTPSSWSCGPDTDMAFVLFDHPIFASGFERGVWCAWTGSTNPICP